MEHKFERLSDEIYIEVSAEHTFGTDALLLAYFASPKNNDRAMDNGHRLRDHPFFVAAQFQTKSRPLPGYPAKRHRAGKAQHRKKCIAGQAGAASL